MFWAKDSRLVLCHPVSHAAPVLIHTVWWLPVKILHLHFLEVHLFVHAGLGRLHGHGRGHGVLKQLHVVLSGHEERRLDRHGYLGHRGWGLVLAPHLASLLRYRHVRLCKRQITCLLGRLITQSLSEVYIMTLVPVACLCGEEDSCPAENSAWWVTAAAAPEAAHSAVGLVWQAVEELSVVAGAEEEVEEAPE